MIFLALLLPLAVLHAGDHSPSGVIRTGSIMHTDLHHTSFSSDADTFDRSGWSFGLNIGGYFADGHSAGFYNGSESNPNRISWVLNNKYYYEDIKRLVNFADTFMLLELPSQMKYNVAVAIGFMAKLNFTNSMGFMISANYARLTTADYFSVEIDPQPFLTQPDIRLYPIYGIEERVMIDLGFSKLFKVGDKSNLFLEAGLNMTDAKVKKHEIEIEGQTFNMVNIYGNQPYIPNTQLQTYQEKQGGIGLGAFFTGGVQLVFNESLSLDPGISVYWKSIQLDGYEMYRPHWNLFVRFSFTSL